MKAKWLAMTLLLCACGGAAADPKAPLSVDQKTKSSDANSARTNDSAPITGTSYKLERDVFRVAISPGLLARTRCFFNRPDAPGSAMVEWDPASPTSPVRRVALRRPPRISDADAGAPVTTSPAPMAGFPEVRCSSEVALYAANTSGKGKAITYVFEQETQTDSPPTKTETLTLTDLEEMKPLGGGKLSVTITKDVNQDPDDVDADETFSRNRSLDPLTPVIEELVRVIAEVAIDRAKAGAETVVKTRLLESVCQLVYAPEGSSEIVASNKSVSTNDRVLAKTCDTVTSVRLEELASNSELIGRALKADLIALAFHALARSGLPTDVQPLVANLQRLALGLVSGQSLGTERDVQSLLLSLGAIKIPEKSAGVRTATKELSSRQWRCAIGAGIAVVKGCLREGACPAERLKNELDYEFSNSTACSDELRTVDAAWPELRSMLARSVDVFRPAPGTSANATAKAAANVLLDAIVTYPQESDGAVAKDQRRRYVPAARTLLNSVFDRNTADGIVAATTLVTQIISAYCESDDPKKPCQDLAVTTPQLTKGMALLNAFAAYASTYSETAPEAAKSDPDKEKLRHEDRKKAMDALIDSVTDRSGRGGDVVWSVGIGVGFGFGRVQQRKLDVGELSGIPQLSMPMGLAIDRLPRATTFWKHFGYHVQMTLLDPAQYITFKSTSGDTDVNIPKPTAATAVALGGQLGLLIGGPQYSAVVGADFGYQPGMLFPGQDRPGAWRFGLFAGTYVPFFDFN